QTLQVFVSPADQLAGGDDAVDPLVLEHRQVTDAFVLHHCDRLLPAGFGADGVRLHRHPVGNRFLPPAGWSVGGLAQEVTSGEDPVYVAVGCYHDCADVVLVHQAQHVLYGPVGRDHDRLVGHNVTDGDFGGIHCGCVPGADWRRAATIVNEEIGGRKREM